MGGFLVVFRPWWPSRWHFFYFVQFFLLLYFFNFVSTYNKILIYFILFVITLVEKGPIVPVGKGL